MNYGDTLSMVVVYSCCPFKLTTATCILLLYTETVKNPLTDLANLPPSGCTMTFVVSEPAPETK